MGSLLKKILFLKYECKVFSRFLIKRDKFVTSMRLFLCFNE